MTIRAAPFVENGINTFLIHAKMNEPGHGWDLWRSFLAVLEHGSLSAAARALALTQPTVGRHVAALEARLGTALFTAPCRFVWKATLSLGHRRREWAGRQVLELGHA
jgi:hypothetical protein